MGRRKGTTRVQEGEEGTRRRGGEGERREAGSAFDSCGLLARGGNTLPCFLLVFSGLADAMNISLGIFVGPLRVHFCLSGVSTQELTSLVCSSYSVSSFIQHISKRIIFFSFRQNTVASRFPESNPPCAVPGTPLSGGGAIDSNELKLSL